MDTNGFDKQMALFLAAVCGQTYTQFNNGDGTFLVPHGYEVAMSFTAKLFKNTIERFGFILDSDDRIIVAFRGTDSATDWIADAVAKQKKYPYVRTAGWTHQGFTDIYSSARTSILSALRKLDSRKMLCITGHSLGGALATLCALDIAVNLPCRTVCVYTYGSPRVGDLAFIKEYGSRIACSHRIYNEHDIVAKLPTPLYKSPITETVYEYMHVKNGYKLQFKEGSVGANHILGNYFAALVKLEPTYAESMCQQNPGFCLREVE